MWSSYTPRSHRDPDCLRRTQVVLRTRGRRDVGDLFRGVAGRLPAGLMPYLLGRLIRHVLDPKLAVFLVGPDLCRCRLHEASVRGQAMPILAAVEPCDCDIDGAAKSRPVVLPACQGLLGRETLSWGA